MAPKRKN
jgi:hypothetical protein